MWLRRFGWVVDLVVIAMCALLLGQAVARGFDPGEAFAAAVTPPRRRTAPVQPRADVALIVERNVFCSGCRGRAAEAPAPALAQTPLPLSVMAIMFAAPPRDPRGSLAVVRDTEDLSIHALAAGDPIRDATVVEIGPTRLLLRRGGETQTLDLLAPAERPRPAPVSPLVASADPLAAELERGVRLLGDRSYEIDRDALNAVLGNTPALVQGARILPELRDGRAVGFRLNAVRPGGPFARIGLRSGDVVSGVNGLPLTAPESALEAFVKLRSASHVSLALERDGRRITHEYRIRN